MVQRWASLARLERWSCTSKNITYKYSNLHGVVILNLTKPLKLYVVACVKGIGNFQIDIEYHTLPDRCFLLSKGPYGPQL